jgi:hypothetical protein
MSDGRWARARPETDLPNERRLDESDLRRSYELVVVSEWGVTVNWLHHPPSQRRQEGGIGTPAPLLVAAQ